MRISATCRPVDPATVNLYDPTFYATGDPHGVWRALRATGPVHWQPVEGVGGFWVLTRYDDVCAVLRGFRDYTSEAGNLLTTLGRKDLASGKMLAVTDPPRHTKIKRQLNACFTPAAVQAFDGELRALARRVLAPGVNGEPFDLAAQTAFYPIAFTALLMGIQQGDWDRLKRFAYVAIADQDPDVTAGHTAHQALEQAHAEIFGYFGRELTKDNTHRDDLTGVIARAEVSGRRLSREDMLFNCYSVLLGATVTTSHAANVGVLALIEHPDQDAAWRASGDTQPLVEEVLRWSSPANHFLRYATRDLEIAGTAIREGDAVTVWLGSANRDEAVFNRPYAFDVARSPVRHIAFGVGAHRCIGAPLARLALQVFFGEMHRLVERFELAGPVDHLASNFISGIKRLPVRAVLRADARHELEGVTPFVAGGLLPT
jgi:cytochrome P450